MKAMILAAGFGKRLQPLTLKRAKPAIPVMNVPLILHNLKFIKRHGINKAVINLHYLPDSIKNIVGDGSRFGMDITYSYETEIMGTAGGLKKAEEFLKNSTFIMVNSDTLIDFDLQDAIRFHRENNSIATMALTDVSDGEEYGPVEVDENSRVRNILGKVKWSGKPLQRRVFVGVHILESRIFDIIPSGVFYEINAQVYPMLIEKGEKVFGYNLSGYWNDVGTLKRYLKVHNEIFQDKIPFIKRKYEVESYQTGENCTITGGNVDLKFAVLGENCRVGNNTAIVESIVLDNVKIGKSVRMKMTIIDNGVSIDDGMVIENSVVYMDARGERKIVPIPD